MSVNNYILLQKYDAFLNVRSDSTNRYYILFLLFYKDYFVYKLANKLMSDGNKQKALRVLTDSLMIINTTIGFQPFFLFKHVAFNHRQIFNLNTTVVRNNINYLPVFLSAPKQVSYGISHLVSSAFQLRNEEHLTMAYALNVVLLNCFFNS